MIFVTKKNNMSSIFDTLSTRLAPVYPSKEAQAQHAWWILEFVTHKSKTQLLTDDILLTEEQHNLIDSIVTQHVHNHKPLAYIIGSIPFAYYSLIIRPPVLIPRMETEEWVINLIHQLNAIPDITEKSLAILDLCSGSGCIAIALAKAFPRAHVTAIDIEQHAIDLIQDNMQHTHVPNLSVIRSDLFAHLEQKPTFDIIVSNPPYITEQEYTHLAPSVTQWEDHKALVAADEGLAIIQRIISQADLYLRNNDDLYKHAIAQLIIEIGHMQGDSVKKLMQEAEYTDVEVKKDYAGKDRIVTGRKNV